MKLSRLPLLAALPFVLSMANEARAIDYTVATLGGAPGTGCAQADGGWICQTLPDAVAAANANGENDTIRFADGLNGVVALDQTLPFLEGRIFVEGPVDADGRNLVALSGQDARRVAYVGPGALEIRLSRLDIVHGRVENDDGAGVLVEGGWVQVLHSLLSGNVAVNGNGGGGAARNGGRLNFSRSTATLNSARNGGGLHAAGGQLFVNNATLSNNSASVAGGGAWSDEVSWVEHATIVENSAPSGAGLASRFPGTGFPSRLVSSVLANNDGEDCRMLGDPFDARYNLIENPGNCEFDGNATGNLIGADPMLGPLQYHGGPTPTHFPLAGSPLVDAVNHNLVGDNATDQRGVAKPQGTLADIGAVEKRLDTLAVSTRGAGTASAAPAPAPYEGGIDGCRFDGGGCMARYHENPAGTHVVALTASPAPDHEFLGWGGACEAAGTAPLAQVPLGVDRACTAAFSIGPLVVSTLGGGEGAGCTFDEAGQWNCETLHDAVAFANADSGDNAIRFAEGLSGTIALQHGLLPAAASATGALDIEGHLDAGGAPAITLDGQDRVHFIWVTEGGVNLSLRKLGFDRGSGSGAFYGYGSMHFRDSQVLLEDCTISNGRSQASVGGGALAIFGGQLSIRRCAFVGNSTAGANADGGALELHGVVATIEHSAFTGNLTLRNGSAIRADTTTDLTIRHSRFSGNSAANGTIYAAGPTRISHSAITGNTVARRGGGLTLLSLVFELDHSTVSGNSATDADGGAGGVALARPSGVDEPTFAAIRHSTIAGNTSAGGVGGLELINLASNGDIELELHASIVAGNSGAAGDDCTMTTGAAGVAIDARHSLVRDAGNCPVSDGAGGNIVGVDPRLAELADNGGDTLTHLPRPGSVLIDAVDCDLIPGFDNSQDQRGIEKPQGGRCDIGAAEARYFVLNVSVAGAGSVDALTLAGGAQIEDCGAGGVCSAGYPEQTVVELSAMPTLGWVFLGWGGDCAADGTVALDAIEKHCTATFLAPFDVSVSIDDGRLEATPGQATIYTIVVRNGSLLAVPGVRLVTTVEPAGALLGPVWACTEASAAHCTPAAGEGHAALTLNPPAHGAVTVELAAQVGAFDERLAVQAAITVPAGYADDPADNVATDTDIHGVLFADGFE